MELQEDQTECGSPVPPSSPESQQLEIDCESLPDIVEDKCREAEESQEVEVEDIPGPSPPKKTRKRQHKNPTFSPPVNRITLASKVTTPCSTAMILGTAGNTGRRHLAAQTKERARLQTLKVRVNDSYWDSKIEGFRFAYEMKPGKKSSTGSAPVDIPKFRRFLRAFERKWVCWGVGWLDSGNQTASRYDLRPDMQACLNHTFPNAPAYLHPTFGYFCDFYITMTVAYHNYYTADMQSHVLTFCPGVYYIVHYCMALGLPSFLISLYLLDVFLVNDCYVTIAELNFTISLIAKSEYLDNYCDWCLQWELMAGHYIEPVEAYNAVFRIVDVISMGVGLDNKCELLQHE